MSPKLKLSIVLWLSAGMHVLVLGLIFIFYRPVPTKAQSEHTLWKAISTFDLLGTALLTCSFTPILVVYESLSHIWVTANLTLRHSYGLAPSTLGKALEYWLRSALGSCSVSFWWYIRLSLRLMASLTAGYLDTPTSPSVWPPMGWKALSCGNLF